MEFDLINRPDEKKAVMFWQIEYQENRGRETIPEIKIPRTIFFNFLVNNGFFRYYMSEGKYIFIHIENNKVKEVNINQIRDFVFDFIRVVPEVGGGFTNEDLGEKLSKMNHILFAESNMAILQHKELDLLKDTAKECYKFYRNCFLKVTSEKIETFQYSQLNRMIWANQIIDRDFYRTEDNKDSEFAQLLYLATGQNDNRNLSIRTTFGYLLHGYKDPANAKAIIFADEKISQPGEANGGSAKSLVASSLTHMSNVWYKGKGFNMRNQFSWQGVTMSTEIIFLDDVSAAFPFEDMFTIITNSITVEDKNKPSFNIPFKDSPKVIITTNYVVFARKR